MQLNCLWPSITISISSPALPAMNLCYQFGIYSFKTFSRHLYKYMEQLSICNCAHVQSHPWTCLCTQTEHETETIIIQSVSEGTIQTTILVSHEITIRKQHLIHENIQTKTTLFLSIVEEIRFLSLSDFP